MVYLIVLIAFIVGGIIFRARGGWPNIPRPFEQMIFCAPLLFILTFDFGWWGLLPYVLCVIAVIRAHGRNADLGGWDKPADREWYENNKPMKWLESKLTPYWYDACGLAVSGLTYTVPMVITSPVLALSGALKAPAFMLGKIIAEKTSLKIKIFKRGLPDPENGHTHYFEVATAWEWGEFLTGAFLWAVWIYTIVKLLIEN